MLISKLNAEHGSREHSDDLSFGYNRTFHGHSKLEAFVYWLRDSKNRIAAFDEAANPWVIPWTKRHKGRALIRQPGNVQFTMTIAGIRQKNVSGGLPLGAPRLLSACVRQTLYLPIP